MVSQYRNYRETRRRKDKKKKQHSKKHEKQPIFLPQAFFEDNKQDNLSLRLKISAIMHQL